MTFFQMFLAVSLALIGLLLGLAILRAWRVESPSRRSQRGIALNTDLRKLVQDIQLHRGMASIVLNGDVSFTPRLKVKQSEITHELRGLTDRLTENHDLVVGEPWSVIQSGWAQLQSQVFQMSVPESFEAHSALVLRVVHLMADVAERSHSDLGTPVARPLSEMLWRRLPELAEDLGKARAIGSGIAAARKVAGVDRIRLHFLVNRIRAGLEIMHRAVEQDQAKQLGVEAHQLIHRVDAAVQRLLEMIEHDLIAVSKPELAAATYFGAATDALEVVYRLFDCASEGLSRPKGRREAPSGFGAAQTA